MRFQLYQIAPEAVKIIRTITYKALLIKSGQKLNKITADGVSPIPQC